MIEFISRLPKGYQEVEYIESSGTQYIDTGISPSENLITQVVFIPDVSAMTEHAMFGSTWSANGYFMMFYQNSLRWHSGGKSVDVSSFETASKNTIICTHTGLTVNGTLHSISPTGSDSTNPIYLFATQGVMNGNKGIYKLVYCAMSLNGVLVREFIPCYRKADSVAGLYDLANNTFYTNAGSGVFAVGSNVGEIVITPGGVISFSAALRRRMMMAGGGGVPISELPLGTLINVGTDGGAGTPNYEIADKDNLVSGGVVLVRKDIYSKSVFGTTGLYPNSTLDNLITATIYNNMSQKLRNKMMDVTFNLSGSGDITRKMFALTRTMAGFGNNNGVAEGKALQLYTSNASRIKTFNGSADWWWLSSQGSSDSVWFVLPEGNLTRYPFTPSKTYGVVFAFAIPSKTPYDPTSNTDGSYNLIL